MIVIIQTQQSLLYLFLLFCLLQFQLTRLIITATLCLTKYRTHLIEPRIQNMMRGLERLSSSWFVIVAHAIQDQNICFHA